jgi:hypothetical protein
MGVLRAQGPFENCQRPRKEELGLLVLLLVVVEQCHVVQAPGQVGVLSNKGLLKISPARS